MRTTAEQQRKIERAQSKEKYQSDRIIEQRKRVIQAAINWHEAQTDNEFGVRTTVCEDELHQAVIALLSAAHS